MKPCQRCGGEKGPGGGRRYCDACSPGLRRAELLAARRAPCVDCGGEKEPGRHSPYCEACAAVRREESHQRRLALKRRRVPVEPFREAFERSGLSKSDLARRLDWYDGARPDAARVCRIINGHWGALNQRTAVAVGEGLGLAPVDFGA